MARILIVEDEQIVAEDLRQQLQRMGHEIAGIACSGEEAVQIAENSRPDLVLMDVRLQGSMEGTEAGHQIQRSTGAPVVFLTAYPEVFLRQPGKMLPPGLCLTKPFSKRQLQVVVDSVLPPNERSLSE
jgi:two-component system, cell cycle sensor histidine kinase and response regulator CckA